MYNQQQENKLQAIAKDLFIMLGCRVCNGLPLKKFAEDCIDALEWWSMLDNDSSSDIASSIIGIEANTCSMSEHTLTDDEIYREKLPIEEFAAMVENEDIYPDFLEVSYGSEYGIEVKLIDDAKFFYRECRGVLGYGEWKTGEVDTIEVAINKLYDELMSK